MIGPCNRDGLCSLDLGAEGLCLIWTNVSLHKIKLKVFPVCSRPRDSLCPFYPFACTTSICTLCKEHFTCLFILFHFKDSNKLHSRDKLQTCVVCANIRDKTWWLEWRKLIRNTYSYLMKNAEPVPFDPCGLFWQWGMFSPTTLQPAARSCFISSLCHPEGKLRNTSARAAFSS